MADDTSDDGPYLPLTLPVVVPFRSGVNRGIFASSEGTGRHWTFRSPAHVPGLVDQALEHVHPKMRRGQFTAMAVEAAAKAILKHVAERDAQKENDDNG